MTRFRLTAGKAAPVPTGRGLSALFEDVPEKAVETEPEAVKLARRWQPNMEPDTIVKCGCRIPWPVVSLLGKQKDGNHGDVWCDLHGWQAVTEKEKARARKGMKQCQPSSPTLDIPPF